MNKTLTRDSGSMFFFTESLTSSMEHYPAERRTATRRNH
jgi:hypothetical protein